MLVSARRAATFDERREAGRVSLRRSGLQSGGRDNGAGTAPARRVRRHRLCRSGVRRTPARARRGHASQRAICTSTRLPVDALDTLPEIIWHYGQPFADPSMVPTYYVVEVRAPARDGRSEWRWRRRTVRRLFAARWSRAPRRLTSDWFPQRSGARLAIGSPARKTECCAKPACSRGPGTTTAIAAFSMNAAFRNTAT